METNIVFGIICAVTGIVMYIWMKREAKKERAAEAVKAAELEAWHEANPGNRWPKVTAVTARKSPADDQDWFRHHSPSFDSGSDSSC